MSRFKTLPLLIVLIGFIQGISHSGQERPEGGEDLARAVTSDSFLCMISRADPEDDFFCESTRKILDALRESGFVEAVTSGVLLLLPEEARESAGELTSRIHEALWRIDWPCMAAYDHVFAERIRDGVVNFVFLVDGEKKFAEYTFQEARKLLAGFVLLTDELQLETERYRGTDITALRLVESDLLDLSVLRRDGLLGFSFGTSRENPRRYMDQLDDLSDTPALVDTDRFKEAFAGLPDKGGIRTYFDIARMFDSLKDRFERLLSSMPEESENPPILNMIFSILNEMDLFEYTSDVRSKKGDLLINESTLQFRPGAADKLIYRSVFLHEPIPHFERFVPKEAVSFNVNSGADLLPLYELVMQLIEDNLQGARDALAWWDSIQETHGIYLKEDLLSWFEGGMITVEVPGKKPGQPGNTVGITLLRLTPSKKGETQAWLAGLLEKLSEAANRIGIKVTLKEVGAEGDSKGFEIYQSMVPFFRPFVCVHEDYLVLSSAREETLAYLDYLSNGGPTILENEKFLSLGLKPPSRLFAIHYRNLQNTVEDFKTALAFLSMASMVLPENSADTIVLKTILKALPRLVPVIEAMDIYEAEVGYAVFDPEAKRLEIRSLRKLKNP